MHAFNVAFLFLGAIILLLVSLVSILQDLIERGPYPAPYALDQEGEFRERADAAGASRAASIISGPADA